MIRDALFLVRMDSRLWMRSPITWMWAFVMPVIFFYFIGTVTGGARSGQTADTIAVLEPADAGPLTDQLVRRLEERRYRVVRVRPEEELARYGRRLRAPAGFRRRLRSLQIRHRAHEKDDDHQKAGNVRLGNDAP